MSPLISNPSPTLSTLRPQRAALLRSKRSAEATTATKLALEMHTECKQTKIWEVKQTCLNEATDSKASLPVMGREKTNLRQHCEFYPIVSAGHDAAGIISAARTGWGTLALCQGRVHALGGRGGDVIRQTARRCVFLLFVFIVGRPRNNRGFTSHDSETREASPPMTFADGGLTIASPSSRLACNSKIIFCL